MSKKNKHASNQAKYMERKREAGLEWLTEWIPAPACQAFKAIAKAARKSHGAPADARLIEAEALAVARNQDVPEWARSSDILLSVWMTSTLAEAALDQVQAEREASKIKKGDAKATKVTSETPEVAEATVAEAEPALEKPVEAKPAKRTRKKAEVAPTESVSE